LRIWNRNEPHAAVFREKVMTTYKISERNLSLYAWPLQHWAKKEVPLVLLTALGKMHVTVFTMFYSLAQNWLEIWKVGRKGIKHDNRIANKIVLPEMVKAGSHLHLCFWWAFIDHAFGF
jgi:hypothetical protein